MSYHFHLSPYPPHLSDFLIHFYDSKHRLNQPQDLPHHLAFLSYLQFCHLLSFQLVVHLLLLFLVPGFFLVLAEVLAEVQARVLAQLLPLLLVQAGARV